MVKADQIRARGTCVSCGSAGSFSGGTPGWGHTSYSPGAACPAPPPGLQAQLQVHKSPTPGTNIEHVLQKGNFILLVILI